MVAPTARARRTQEILDATRRLLDARGVRDALIEDIAGAVGINRAIIYRHFSSKEELFAMTLVGYLGELENQLAQANDPALTAAERLGRISDRFLDFGSTYPAFVDCAQALLRFRGADLFDAIRYERLVELGAAMNHCLHHVVIAVEAGNVSGEFEIADPELFANIAYTMSLGLLNLMAFRMSVRELDTGLPSMQSLPREQVYELARRALVSAARP